MKTQATVIADSISVYGKRLTTFSVTFPRFILPEVNTHRALSRNASSSRAIPVAKLIAQVRESPYVPGYWGANKPGMSASEEVSELHKTMAEKLWISSAQAAADTASALSTVCKVHKQLANRLLEPYLYTNMVISATDWDNFYALRCHADAQPEIKQLADCMLAAHNVSKPVLLDVGQWHTPYADNVTQSVARCCRVSYNNHEGKESTLDEDIVLCKRLFGSAPIHASPTEHQATSLPGRHGNFDGWRQYRQFLRQNTVERFEGLR